MKRAPTRFHALLLALLLISCEKPKHADRTTSPEKRNPQATKSNRTTESVPASPPDLRRSLENATAVTTPEERDAALARIVEEVLETDMAIAREAFDQLSPDGPERARIMSHFAMRLAEQDRAGAIRWAESLATDEEKSIAFGNIALVLSASDPEAAATMLSDSGVPSRDFDVAVVQVVQRWAAQSPAEAAAWVVQFDAGEARSAGLQAIATQWLEENPQAAYSWIQSIQEPAIRDEALTGMAMSILELPDSEQITRLKLASPELRARVEALKAEAAD